MILLYRSWNFISVPICLFFYYLFSLNGHEFEQTLGDTGGQRSLMCCSPWDCGVGHDLMTEKQQFSLNAPWCQFLPSSSSLVFISAKISNCCLFLDCVWFFLPLLSCGCLSSGLFCFWRKFLFHGLCVCIMLGDSFLLPWGIFLGLLPLPVVATMVLCWDSCTWEGVTLYQESCLCCRALQYSHGTLNTLLCVLLCITCWDLPSTWTSSFLYPRA